MEYDLSISRTMSIKHNKNLEFPLTLPGHVQFIARLNDPVPRISDTGDWIIQSKFIA